jgi:hypothetical protein
MADKNKPFFKHSHPAYGWVAIVISIAAIFGVAGWYYLTYTDGLNADLVLSAQNLVSPKNEPSVSSSAASTTVDVSTDVDEIDKSVNSVADTDFADAQLDNTILGIK